VGAFDRVLFRHYLYCTRSLICKICYIVLEGSNPGRHCTVPRSLCLLTHMAGVQTGALLLHAYCIMPQSATHWPACSLAPLFTLSAGWTGFHCHQLCGCVWLPDTENSGETCYSSSTLPSASGAEIVGAEQQNRTVRKPREVLPLDCQGHS
jgi:hypothetical protein